MATGIPKQGTRPTSPNRPTPAGALGLTLHYEGKRTRHEIIGTPPAEMNQVWPAPTSDHVSVQNSLFFGDNLPALASLLQDPAVRGQVRLIYIDPPYATGGVFQSRGQKDAYDDLLVGAHFVEFLRERLILMHELLADNGSIYVHLDKNMAFAIKVIMDEVFGPQNFRSWITRKKCNPKNYTSKTYGNVADFILFYTKSDDYIWHRPYEEWTDARALKEYSYVNTDGRRYKKVPVHAPGVRHGETGKPWRDMLPPPGKHWQYTPARLDEMDAQGEIYWSPTGNPRRKVYFDESAGIPVQDIWLDFKDAHNQNIRITGFPTEKNPALLQRIIEASSNPGDLVLDCFSGSGTTLAAASQVGRRWIGIDESALALATILRRFACGLQPMGDFVSARSEEDGLPEAMQMTLLLNERRASGTYGAPDFILFADGKRPLPEVPTGAGLLDMESIFLAMAEKGE
jgi:adenine-specific DNA-methyltransferase